MTNETFKKYMMLFKVNYRLNLDPEDESAKAVEDRTFVKMLRDRLAKYSDHLVVKAFETVIDRCVIRPTIADFMLLLDPSPRDPGKVAWSKVLSLMHRYGDMRNQFCREGIDSALVQALKDIGGLYNLAHMHRPGDLEEAFKDAYRLRSSQGLDARPGQIIGYREQVNNLLPEPSEVNLPELTLSTDFKPKELTFNAEATEQESEDSLIG